MTFAIAPAVSVFLWQHGIGRQQYAWATGVAALGAACLFLLPRRYDVRTVRAHTIVLDRRWLPACFFAAATVLQGGVNGSIAILTFHDRGIVNGAAIFSASAFTAFVLRYPAGRLVDRFGPRIVALPTAGVQVVGCVLAAQAHSLAAVTVAGACLGTAWAAVVPVSIGLLFERSASATRGAAMGAYNLAFSGGAACGALLATAATLAGPGYPLAITLCGIAPLAVLPYVWRSGASARPPMRLSSAAGVAGE